MSVQEPWNVLTPIVHSILQLPILISAKDRTRSLLVYLWSVSNS